MVCLSTSGQSKFCDVTVMVVMAIINWHGAPDKSNDDDNNNNTGSPPGSWKHTVWYVVAPRVHEQADAYLLRVLPYIMYGPPVGTQTSMLARIDVWIKPSTAINSRAFSNILLTSTAVLSKIGAKCVVLAYQTETRRFRFLFLNSTAQCTSRGMEIVYVYQKPHKEFGRACKFGDLHADTLAETVPNPDQRESFEEQNPTGMWFRT